MQAETLSRFDNFYFIANQDVDRHLVRPLDTKCSEKPASACFLSFVYVILPPTLVDQHLALRKTRQYLAVNATKATVAHHQNLVARF